MFKQTKIYLAMVLALMMCLTFVNFASADDPSAEGINKAAIAKVLQTPNGVDISALEAMFSFKVKAVSVSGTNYNSTTSNMPIFGTNPNISDGFGTFSVGHGTDKTVWQLASGGESPDYTHTYYIETGDIFADYPWTAPGDYLYEITENKNTYTPKGAYPDPNSDKMEYSNAVYNVKVYVRAYEAGDDIPLGKSVGDVYIKGIGAFRVTTDANTPGGNEKVNPTPGGEGGEFDYSGMSFTNKYGKVNGSPYYPDPDPDDGGPNNPDPTKPTHQTLYFNKTVAGNTGDPSKYFNYEMTIYRPTVVDGTKLVYRAYVVDSNGIVTTTANGAGSGQNYIDFTTGTTKTFSLKHGQSLVFVDTPVGMWYEITEKASDHTPSASAVYATGPAKPIGAGSVDTDYVLPGTLGENVRKLLFVNEIASGLAFTNTRQDGGPITGLDINDLPFAGLIVLAASALVVFVIVKFRKRQDFD